MSDANGGTEGYDPAIVVDAEAQRVSRHAVIPAHQLAVLPFAMRRQAQINYPSGPLRVSPEPKYFCCTSKNRVAIVFCLLAILLIVGAIVATIKHNRESSYCENLTTTQCGISYTVKEVPKELIQVTIYYNCTVNGENVTLTDIKTCRKTNVCVPQATIADIYLCPDGTLSLDCSVSDYYQGISAAGFILGGFLILLILCGLRGEWKEW